jgi:hypothetical protein
MMEAVRTSETSVDNHFTRQYIPEDNSEHHTRRRENLKSHKNKYVPHANDSRSPEDQQRPRRGQVPQFGNICYTHLFQRIIQNNSDTCRDTGFATEKITIK